MSTTDTPAGWHPDPADPGGGGLRWWDGGQWTHHTQPGPTPSPLAGAIQPPAPGSPLAPPPYGPVGNGQTPSTPYGQAPYGQAPYAPYGQMPYGPSGTAGGAFGSRRRFTVAGSGPNSFSWTAIGFSVAYVALAVATHFALLGIVPVVASIRAAARREPLSPVAIAAAVISVVVSVLTVSGHHV